MILETLLALLTAHLIGDFVAQNDWMVENKKRFNVLLLHVFVLTALTALVMGTWSWPILAGTFGSHLAIDWIKSRAKDNLLTFTLDQAAHLMAALVIAIAFPIDFSNNVFLSQMPAAAQTYYFTVMIYAAGFIITVYVGAVVVGKTVGAYAQQITDEPVGLPGAGRMIGKLERFLIFLLMIAGQASGIGFLVAAKSILRFGEITKADRKLSEYIIIGTFVSFAWAIACGYLTLQLLALWRASADR